MALKFLILFIALSGFCQAQSVQIEFGTSTPSAISNNFIPIHSGQLTNNSPFWLRVTINSPSEREVVLKAGNWYMQGISFYDSAGHFFNTGNYHEVSLKEGENIFYLYYPFKDIKDKNGASVSLSSITDFNVENLRMRTWQFVFASIIGLLFLLSTIYSMIIRSSDKIYTHYAFYLLTILIFFSYQHGLLGDALHVVTLIPPAWFWIFSDFITITYIYFSQSFLNMKNSDPLLFKVFNFGKYLVGSMVIIETVSYLLEIDVLHAMWFKGPIMAFEILVLPFILYRVYRLKTTLSWLFLISVVVLGVANLAGQIASTYKDVSFTNYFIQSATLIDTFLFSIGIGIRFGIANREKQKIQNNLIDQLKINAEIMDRNSAELEFKVKERTEALNKRNQENELLVKEIHHRVKNNMQVISSMLNIAGKKIVDEKTRQPFLDSTNRINSMGLIHSFLYQNEDYPNVNTKKYITQLTKILSETFNSSLISVHFQHDVHEKVNLDMDSAINVGLIINELTTNSIKHGSYPGYTPVITISLNECDGKNHLSVKDNGKNNPTTDHDVNRNFGLRLVDALAKKLNGEVIVTNLDGFEVKVIF